MSILIKFSKYAVPKPYNRFFRHLSPKLEVLLVGNFRIKSSFPTLFFLFSFRSTALLYAVLVSTIIFRMRVSTKASSCSNNDGFGAFFGGAPILCDLTEDVNGGEHICLEAKTEKKTIFFSVFYCFVIRQLLTLSRNYATCFYNGIMLFFENY